MNEEKKAKILNRRGVQSINNYSLIKSMSKYTFCETQIVGNKKDDSSYLMKIFNKHQLQPQHSSRARSSQLMQGSDSQWLLQLFATFQNDDYLYCVHHFDGKYNLLNILNQNGILTENKTVFYMKQLLSAIQAIHELDVVHREITPNNIFITNDGHLQLCQYDSSQFVNTNTDLIIAQFQKITWWARDHKEYYAQHKNEIKKVFQIQKQQKTELIVHGFIRKMEIYVCKNQFQMIPPQIIWICTDYYHQNIFHPKAEDTFYYIAPEVLSSKGYDKMVDFWSFGVIVFECLIGHIPIYGINPMETCYSIRHYRKYIGGYKDYPKTIFKNSLSPKITDLLRNLLCSYRRRYGFKQIKNHSLFKDTIK